MKKLFPLICCVFLFATASKAQYVNIPDSNFRNALINRFPSCFNALKQMDTSCSTILNTNYLSIYSNPKPIYSIAGIQYFKSLKKFECNLNKINSLGKLPDSLLYLSASSNKLTSIQGIPMGIRYVNVMNNPDIINVDSLPSNIDSLLIGFTTINSIPSCVSNSNNLKYLNISCSKVKNLTSLPNSLKFLEHKLIDSIFTLPSNLESLVCAPSYISSLPSSLKYLECRWSNLVSLPQLPTGLKTLICANSKKLSTLPILNDSLETIESNYCSYSTLPQLPNKIVNVTCGNNDSLRYFIGKLPDSIKYFHCSYSPITSLPNLPLNLETLTMGSVDLTCLPMLPPKLTNIIIDWGTDINCIPNLPNSLVNKYPYYFSPKNLCNPINNSHLCPSYLNINTFTYVDFNHNGKYDSFESPKKNVKINLVGTNSVFTNAAGNAYLNAVDIGNYTVLPTSLSLFDIVPTSFVHNFINRDTLVLDTFALQPNVLKDSIAIKLTPTNWAARTGRAYPYLVNYENVGTTVLSNANIGLQYDNSLLIYDSSSNNAVTNSGSNLSVNVGNIAPGQIGSFIAYFKVKTTAVLNSSITSIASITTNTVAATDTITTVVLGSYDPNDKQATPSLTTQQVGDGRFIDYTIRFQNTGTDTAFSVVIADTLDSKLQANQLQMVSSSHPCKTTVKDNVIFFEFLDIMLPDSNINKFRSNGFVSFKIKPVATVTDGTIIPNKAAIYFDYNSPVITKPANTIIQNPLPLQLLSFSAIPQKETDKILVYWNTANEINTAYFIIETSSNGNSFKASAEVAAKGIGNNSYFYSIDKLNVVYVRLKMVDKDGRFVYSKIIRIPINQLTNEPISIVANPTKNQLQLKVNSSSLNNTNASLANAQGRVVKRFILKQGNLTIDISNLTAGVYYLQSNEGSRKVVVE